MFTKKYDRNKKKVLIVDDDADFVSMNKKVLERNGYEVSIAYNGKEGLERVDSDIPDIILLDMMMETWSELAELFKNQFVIGVVNCEDIYSKNKKYHTFNI